MRVHDCLISLLVAAGAAVAVPAAALSQGGSVSGVVRDSASRPVAGADVVAFPGNHRTRTDSAGAFTIGGLDADQYTVRARKLGFGPTEFRVSLAKNGHVDIKLWLEHSAPMLDTMRVIAGRVCPLYSLDGFVCRKKAGTGVFLDYTDIDDKAVTYTADLFRDVKGFRVDVRSTRLGPVRVPVASNGFGCITSLVDGHPVTAAFAIPSLAGDLVAVEIYARADSVPAQFQRYTWPAGDITRSGRCAVVIYWTLWAPMS
jgi:hypothetical protein